ncbi:hypothetical protein N9064_00585 [bacterium]|nr:hypothetical protein [bacterium]
MKETHGTYARYCKEKDIENLNITWSYDKDFDKVFLGDWLRTWRNEPFKLNTIEITRRQEDIIVWFQESNRTGHNCKYCKKITNPIRLWWLGLKEQARREGLIT